MKRAVTFGVTVDQWGATGFAARVLLLVATGVAWTVMSLQSVLLHPDYVNPATHSDWVSIWAYTTTWLLTAVAILIFGEVARPDTLMRRTIYLVAIASIATGVANALEDGFEVGGFGSVYVFGILTAVLGMVFMSAMTWAGQTRWLWFVPLFAALAAFTMVLGGGPLALVAWGGLAAILVRARSAAPRGA